MVVYAKPGRRPAPPLKDRQRNAIIRRFGGQPNNKPIKPLPTKKVPNKPTGSLPKPKPKPKSTVPTLDDYLAGDSVLADQRSQLTRLLEDFRAQNTNQAGDVNQDFQIATQRMAKEKERATKDITADYAARGVLNSGLYANSLDEYGDEYQDRLMDLTTDRERTLNDLSEALRQFESNIRGQELTAEQEAARRHAEQYGIGMPGTATDTAIRNLSRPAVAKTFRGMITDNRFGEDAKWADLNERQRTFVNNLVQQRTNRTMRRGSIDTAPVKKAYRATVRRLKKKK